MRELCRRVAAEWWGTARAFPLHSCPRPPASESSCTNMKIAQQRQQRTIQSAAAVDGKGHVCECMEGAVVFNQC